MEMIKIMSALKLSKEDNIPSEIIENLFLGSIGTAMNLASL